MIPEKWEYPKKYFPTMVREVLTKNFIRFFEDLISFDEFSDRAAIFHAEFIPLVVGEGEVFDRVLVHAAEFGL